MHRTTMAEYAMINPNTKARKLDVSQESCGLGRERHVRGSASLEDVPTSCGAEEPQRHHLEADAGHHEAVAGVLLGLVVASCGCHAAADTADVVSHRLAGKRYDF